MVGEASMNVSLRGSKPKKAEAISIPALPGMLSDPVSHDI
jgi:hypothetical protein